MRPLRQRLDAVVRGLERRAFIQLGGWIALLRDLGEPPRPETVEWLAIERFDGAETDIAVNRNWIDPGIPFAAAVAKPAHGLLVTSATLTDGEAEPDLAWRAAEAATGLRHLPESPASARIPSPFDYAAQTRVLIVTDIPRDDIGQVAAAFAALMRASQGGALGLFTAIARLRAVHERIAPVLEADGLLAAGAACRCDVDRDAGRYLPRRGGFLPARHRRGARRGGRAGPLAAADRVRPGAMAAPRHPAPRAQAGVRRRAIRRPHHAAAAAAGLWQAGAPGRRSRRLRRCSTAHLPSRLLAAFPPGVPIRRLGLAEAVDETARFLGGSSAEQACGTAARLARRLRRYRLFDKGDLTEAARCCLCGAASQTRAERREEREERQCSTPMAP